MTDFESQVFEKLDGIHARINEVHDRIGEISNKQAAHEIHINTLVGNGQPGKIAAIEAKLDEHEALVNQRKGMGKLGKIAWAAIAAILGSDLLAHASEIFKKLSK